ncbi:hypothetical protein B9Z19DRAFT_1131842 [Tuber borchii]|uniref:Uncharacterized protein n=1 Tax=Tuber borchii TaxID=42251 RepID=A0A2T6ZI60_TUBBO|nr:hypothetical protein B9Z19DRAFT_1131842 [Tuber borchii]
MASTPSSMRDSDGSSGHPSSPSHSVTPASRNHSAGGAAIFPTAPAIGHPSTIPKHPQSLCDVQTSDLDLTPHEKKVIAYPRAKTAWSLRHPAGDLPSPQQLLEQQEFKWYLRFQEDTTEEEDKGTSSLPYPIKNAPSPQQLLEQQEAKWYQRLKDYASERRAKDRLQFLGYQAELHQRSAEWHEKSYKKDREILELSVQIEHLIFTVLYGKTENMRLKENFNAKGALERMVHYAKLRKKIGTVAESQGGQNQLGKNRK